MRTLIQRAALVFGAVLGVLVTPAGARAQKALVYCPVNVDATGCNAIVNALTGPSYPLGVDRGYDGTGGTVDLKTVDLFTYSVFVVPSLADGAASQPYAKLREAEVVEHLKAALIGRIAMWSGTPDQGATNRALKDALIQNLAGWAGGAFGTAKGPGLVALLDASSNAGARYDWVRAITPLPVTSDANLLIYNSVRTLNPRGTTILTSGSGPLIYDNMATFGFQVPNGAAGVSLDAVGQTGTSVGGQVVLLTVEAGNSTGAVVKTDKDDYAPGTTVVITGSGWEPGETVKLTLHMDPLRDADTELTAIADADSKFTNTEFAPKEYDVGVRFVLTAVGQTSGRRAQTTFTDAASLTITFAGNGTGTVTSSAFIPINCSNATSPAGPTCTGSSTTNGSVTLTATPASGSVFVGWTTSGGGSTGCDNTSNNPCTVNLTGNKTVTATFTKNAQAPQTITFAALPNKTYGDAPFTLSATASSGLAVTYALGTGSAGCTLSGTNNSTVTITAATAAGQSCIVVASQPGNASFTAAPDVTQSFTIAKAPLAVTADNKTRPYGDANPPLTATITGFVNGENLGTSGVTGTPSLTTTAVANTPVGTVAIAVANGTLAASNYDFTFANGQLAITPRLITVTADPKSKSYGAADPAFTYQISGGSLVAGDALGGTLARATGEAVGTYPISQGTLTGGANYTIAFVGTDLTITARALTVTADAKSKVYGDADPALTYQVTTGSLAAGDAFSGTLTRAAGESVAGSPYAIQLGTLTAGPNYTITFVSANLTISARPITVTADAKSKIYGDADPALTYQVTSGSLAFSDALTGTLNRASGEAIGSYAISQGTLSAGTNYTLTFAGANLAITARPVTVAADAKSKMYGDPDPALTYQISSGSLAAGDNFSGALTRAPGTAVGTYAIQQGTLALNSNYTLTFIGADLTIDKRPITITADAKSKMYGDADPALTYQLTSGTLVAPDAFTGSLSRDSGDNVGTYAITQGTLSAGSNYDLTFVSANLTIIARAITVTADAQTKTYGDADPALTYQVTTGSLASGDAFSGALARDAGVNVGTYAIKQGTLSAGANYALTYVGASLTITVRPVTVTANAQTKVYGDPDPSLTYSVTSGSLVSGDAFSGALTRAAGGNVGTYAINQGTLTLSANYVLTYVGANLTITPRPITITADAKSKVYGEADPGLTYQITAGTLVPEDAITGALTRDAGENVGDYPIKQGTVALSSNYTLTYVGANLTITPRPVTITADATSKTYGDPDPALTYQITSGSLAFSDEFSGTLTRASGQDVGAYAILVGTVTLGANYNLTFIGANLTINKRPITVTANAQTKVYGDADPALTYITTGTLAFSDAFSGALTRDAGESVGSYAISQGTFTAGGNYTLTFVGASLSITKRPVMVTADAATKIYGNPDPALTYQITGGSLAFTDAFTGALTRVAGENVGTYAIEQSTLALSGNYDLTYVGAIFSITPRAIAVTADPQSKVYGESDPTLTYQITSGTLVGSDAFSGMLTRAAGENVGTYAIAQGTLSLSTNYTLSYAGANLTITQRPISLAADAKSKTYGDADPAFTYQITSGNLVFGNTFTGDLTRGTGEDVGTYPILVGGVTAGPNYDVTYVGADLTIIQRPIAVTADAQTKVYGDADPALSYQITNGSLAFTDAFTGALARAAGQDVGTYAITQGSLALSANYTLTYNGALLTITKRPVTITADGKTKVYGAADPALTFQITSGTLAFSDAFSGTLSRVTGDNVGTYAIQQGTVALTANYMLTYVGANLAITPHALTVAADDKSKIAGAVNPVLTGNIVGIQFSDNITATYSTTAVALSLPATYPITPALVDPGSKLGNYTVNVVNGTLTVTPNAKPVLGTITAPLLPTAVGTPVSVSAPFTDVDVAASQPYTATIDWGNGTTSTSAFTSPGTITGSKNYPVAGVYTITVTIRQDNFPTTHFDTKTFEYYVVVYDPNGGFVTGGGWIDSPAGAYAPNASLTGKATFGFVSKYKKGQTIPDGNTEFQFHAGGMNFKGTAYEWLVIAGAKAQYKGTGTINGSGNYGFMLSAIDGQIPGGGGADKFRIKIWDKDNNDAVVYDNQITGDTSETATPTTGLGGGSINIQAK